MYFSPPNLNTFFFPKRAGVTGVQCRGADFLRDGERLKAYIIDIVVRKKWITFFVFHFIFEEKSGKIREISQNICKISAKSLQLGVSKAFFAPVAILPRWMTDSYAQPLSS